MCSIGACPQLKDVPGSERFGTRGLAWLATQVPRLLEISHIPVASVVGMALQFLLARLRLRAGAFATVSLQKKPPAGFCSASAIDE